MAPTRPNLHYAHINGDYIFLCLEAGRYFLLRGTGARRFDRNLRGEATRADLDWLIEQNIISHGSGGVECTVQRLARPTSCFLDMPSMRASLVDTASAIAAQLRARRELRVRELAGIVDDLRQKGRNSGSHSPPSGLAVAAAFHRARHYMPAIDQCLVRGLAMKRMLQDRNSSALMVIGVMMPFTAHCWVQEDDTVLGSGPIDLSRPL